MAEPQATTAGEAGPTSAPMRARRCLGVCAEGWPFILPALGLALLAALLFGPLAAAPFLALGTLMLWFFRDPERTPPADEQAVLAPADGRVVRIEKGVWPSFPHGEATRVSIFLSIFNVHVNRAPFQGVVRAVERRPGRFLAAFAEKASLVNEQTLVTIDTPRGVPLAFSQIAGLIARRIVCRLEPGQEIRRAERYGLIRFGSRMDVYLPAAVELRAAPGQRVRAGCSVLGHFR